MMIDATNFSPVAYAKQEHLPFLESLAVDLYGRHISDWQAESLKTYQDLFAYAFIRHNIAPGSRLLEVGGGYSRVLTRLAKEYVCWNIDRFEGLGAGPVTIPQHNYRIVRGFMGGFNPELADESFDLVFSISMLQHVPKDSPSEQEAMLKDIQRVIRPGGLSLHLVDVVAFEGYGWYPPIVDLAAKTFPLTPPPPSPSELASDPELYCMSRGAYETQWQPITGTSYERFGRPTSLHILWQRPVSDTRTRSTDRSSASISFQEKTVYDIGMHKGEDTAFYLAKGFRVIAVDANPSVCVEARTRFADAVADGRLTIVNAAIAENAGSKTFFLNLERTEWSSLIKDIAERDGQTCRQITVPTRSLSDIILEYGVPYYVKIDIEGYDSVALLSLCGTDIRPAYVSVENGAVELPILIKLGYKSFQYVQQRDIDKLRLPFPAREGNYVPFTFDAGASGPFGAELSGRWMDTEEIRAEIGRYWNLETLQKRPDYSDQTAGWFDLHARWC